MIKTDIDDPQSLVPAFEGATVIFSNTDFFTHLQYALTFPDQWHTTDEITKYAYDREVTQGINIAKVAASPLILRTLERFIYSSLCDVRKWSQGKYTTVHHYNSKTDTIRAIEAQFPDLAARMSTVQLGHYVTMWKAFPSMAPLKQPNGSFLMTRQVSEGLKFPFVAAHRDTGSFVKVLVDLPPKKDLLGVSETLTWPEWMAVWGDVLGVEARFQQVSKDDFFRDVPQALRKDLEDTYDFIEEFGFTGGDPAVLTPEEVIFPYYTAFMHCIILTRRD